MAHGTISNSVLLAGAGFNIKSSYTYHFASSLPSYANGYTVPYSETSGGMSSYQMDSSDFYDVTTSYESLIGSALTGMASVGGVSFNYSTSSSSDINIWGLNTTLYIPGTTQKIGGFGYFPPTGAWSVGLDSDLIITNSSLPTDWVIAHELNHTIGLYDAATTSLQGTSEDNARFTIMSYNLHPGTGSYATELQLYDIASIQALYGRAANNSGDTTYSDFGSSSLSRMFSIWDSGGTDTIDASAQSDAVLIDLRPGYFSSIGPGATAVDVGFSGDEPVVTNPGQLNVSIAFGAYVENAKGTAENDLIIGNVLSNTLWGGAGDDIIYAEGGSSVYDACNGDYRQISDTATNNVEAAPTSIQEFVNDLTKQSNTLYGEDGNDYLFGSDGYDILYGGDDNDYIDTRLGLYNSSNWADDEAYGGDGDDIIVVRSESAKVDGEGGDDQIWIDTTDLGSNSYTWITDADEGDALYYNGYLLTGGTKVILDFEITGQGSCFIDVGCADSNGFRYYLYDEGSLYIETPDGSEIYVDGFDDGDMGLYVGSVISSADLTATYDSDNDIWHLPSLSQSSITYDNEIQNWEDLPGYLYTASHYGSNQLPTTWIEPVI